MKKRVCLFFLLAAISCSRIFAEGNGDGAASPRTLSEIDEIIKSTEYDNALTALHAYLAAHPEHFDRVQTRVKKIFRARNLYTQLADQFFDTLYNDPDNNEKLGNLTDRLLALEKDPKTPILQLIKEHNDIAAIARYSSIQNKTAQLTVKGDYAAAAKTANEGFFLYRDAFNEMFAGTERQAGLESSLSEINTLIAQYEGLQRSLEAAKNAYIAALRAGNIAGIESAFQNVQTEFSKFADLRNQVCETGRLFDKQYGDLGRKTDVHGIMFYYYARGCIFGWREEPNLGVLGAMDGQWNAYMGEMKTRSAETASAKSASLEKSGSLAKFDKKAAATKTAVFTDLRALSAVAQNVNALDSLLISEKDGEKLKPEENYRLSFQYLSDGSESSLALVSHASEISDNLRAASAFSYPAAAVTTEREGADNSAPLFAAYDKLNDVRSDAAKNDFSQSDTAKEYTRKFAAQKNSRAARRQAANAASQEPEDGSHEESAPDAGRSNTNSIIEWKSFDKSMQRLSGDFISYADSSAASILSRAADFYSSCGLEYITEAGAQKDRTEELINGVRDDSGQKSDDSLAIVKRYPKEGLESLSALDAYIASAEKVLSSALKRLDTPFTAQYKTAYTSVQKSAELLARLKISTVSMRDSARTMATLAENAKNDAAEKFAAAKRALSQKNFKRARENLARAAAKYLEALSYNEDDALRSSSDRDLRELGEEINRQENVLVVKDVRELKNQARAQFDRDNFEGAERLLRRAAERWAVTNVEPDAEIVNIMALVETALSMKGGRAVLPGDQLYTEVSQILSIANQYYDQGVRLLNQGRKSEGVQRLNDGLQKLKELRDVVPLNQEANLLNLKIQKIMNPEEFRQNFGKRIATARANIKDPKKRKEAYSELDDLYKTDPDYPGFKQLMYDVKVELGIIRKPPDTSGIKKSAELTEQARRMFSSAGRDDKALMRSAMALADQAIALNAANGDAIILKDEISRRLDGNATVVISAHDLELYNRAVQYLRADDVIGAKNLVAELLKNPKNRYSSQILELEKRIKLQK
ncbi:MAG: hypothetical protein ACTTKL_05905 [Treponema sp.]